MEQKQSFFWRRPPSLAPFVLVRFPPLFIALQGMRFNLLGNPVQKVALPIRWCRFIGQTDLGCFSLERKRLATKNPYILSFFPCGVVPLGQQTQLIPLPRERLPHV